MGSLVLRGPPSLPRRSQVKTLWPEVRDSPSDLSLSGAWLSLLTQQHGCIQASCPEPLNCGQTDFFQSTRGCDRSLFTPPKVSLSIKNNVQARHQSLWGLDPAYFGAQLAGSLPCSCPGHLLLPPSTPGPSRLLIRSLRLCPPRPPFSWDQSSFGPGFRGICSVYRVSHRPEPSSTPGSPDGVSLLYRL